MINNYDLIGINEDHDLFNTYLARENKTMNNKKAATVREEESGKIVESDNLGDIWQKFEEDR